MITLAMMGFQNGADIAGAKASKDFGIPTTGWMPKGYKTLDGPKPEYKDLYNAKEHVSDGYKMRTWQNVYDADATIRFANNFKSAGEICTKNAIDYYKKPYFDVKIHDAKVFETDWTDEPHEAAKWILYYNIKILNIAGNAESTTNGIGEWVYKYLMKMFKEVQNLEEMQKFALPNPL